MSRLLWVGAWFAVAVWSLFALATYGVLDLVGGFAQRNADQFSADPDTVVQIWRVFGWMRSLSTSVALVVWGVVSLAILSVPWLFDRMVGRALQVDRRGAYPYQTGPFARPVQDGVIDLAPDQYSVRPGPSGPVPPIPGRPTPRLGDGPPRP